VAKLLQLWKQTKLVLKRLRLTFPTRKEIDNQLLTMRIEEINEMCDVHKEIRDDEITYS